ncbi:putative phosphatidylethanolamine-binding protein [Helianthus annuus]|nr:putative phosphatidylethanolamine-binding protein [Helianthus annuus]
MQCLVSCDEHLSHSHLILYITGLKYFHYRHTNIFHKRHSNTILNMDPRAYFDVINDVVGNFMDPFVPTVTVTAYFGDHRLTNCSELRLTTAQIAPRVVIGGNQDELYTLIMVDPDAPNPNEPSSREVVLWIVTNIPGGTSTAEGREFMAYDVPNPQVGLHRFIMLLYRQASPLNEIEALPSRDCFKSNEFAEKHNLGTPLGIAYFYVRRQARRNA